VNCISLNLYLTFTFILASLFYSARPNTEAYTSSVAPSPPVPAPPAPVSCESISNSSTCNGDSRCAWLFRDSYCATKAGLTTCGQLDQGLCSSFSGLQCQWTTAQWGSYCEPLGGWGGGFPGGPGFLGCTATYGFNQASCDNDDKCLYVTSPPSGPANCADRANLVCGALGQDQCSSFSRVTIPNPSGRCKWCPNLNLGFYTPPCTDLSLGLC